MPHKTADRYPASLIQEQFWLINKLQPDNPAYNISSFFNLQGNPDLEALTKSLKHLIRRHEILRTTFSREENRLYQIVARDVAPALEIVDMHHLTPKTRQKKIRRLIRQEITTPFDLSNGPLLRITLFCHDNQHQSLLIVMHHIITDLRGKEIFSSELSALYRAYVQGNQPDLPQVVHQYKDFAIWQQSRLQKDKCQSMTSYWQQTLNNYSGYLDLPTDRTRPPVQEISGSAVPFQLSKSFTAVLKEFARRQNTDIFLILLTAYFVLLHRYTNQRDMIIGVPLTNRRREEHKDIMGCLVNILPIAINASPDQSFEEILRQIRLAMLGAHRNQELPYELIVRQHQSKTDASFNPLFQTGFTFEPLMELSLDGLQVFPEKIHTQGAQLDLFFTLWEEDNELHGFIEFNSTLFNESTINRLAGNYRTLLWQIADQPQLAITSLNILTEQEKYQQLIRWNDTSSPLPDTPLLHKLFEEQSTRTPDNIAVTCAEHQLTYRQLNRRANQLAHYLGSLDVAPGDLIGVCMDRSSDMLTALFAILKAGCAYVPLDPAFPKDRLAFMLEDTGLGMILTEENTAGRLPDCNCQKIMLDSSWPEINKESTDTLQTVIVPDSLAYVIYTSGSTGKPKGVQVPHRAVVNFLLSMSRKPGITDSDILLAVTTLSFDISVLELFLPLIIGGRTVIANRETTANGELLRELLRSSKATIMQATPTTWYLLMAAGWQGRKDFKILCGGEPLPPEMVSRLTARSANVWNMYGPTETTVWSTCHRISTADSQVLVGRPIANTQIYIVNEANQPNPVGVAGEMLIGGAGITRGYLNRVDLSREKFISDIFHNDSPTQKLYRTGDLACWWPDGTIKVLGRIDNQIKLRGYRIELGEIDIVLESHSSVRQAATIVREDDPGDRRLTAYIVPAAGRISKTELRQYLRSKLPEYMVPAKFIRIDEMPLTLNGKIDRRALPKPEQTESSPKKFITPQKPLEKKLAGLWAEVLKTGQVGVHDNFFDMGGNSLLSVHLVDLLEEKMGFRLPVVKFYQHPTIASLAGYLASQASDGEPARSSPTRTEQPQLSGDEEIAIIGMAGRFPGAGDIEQFWDNLVNGVESILTFSDEELLARGVSREKLNNPQYVKAGTLLDDAEMFDADFFGYNRHEAKIMDPQQRVFLEIAWQALESAGYNPDTYNGHIGVFAGTSGNDYRKYLAANQQSITSGMDSFELMMGNDADFLTTRVSYKLNLRGPSFNIQTACSTSLVAVHQACRSLLSNECDMALAGGVCIRFPQGQGYLYQEGMIWSKDGHCRPFDAQAQGTIFGQGAGIVVVKRLSQAQADNDTILAVIKGSAINNDGATKVGFTAPSVNGQAETIRAAMTMGKVQADTISYVETHGTGTPLGDPIEIEALAEAFGKNTSSDQYCAIGSIKSNIGHLDAAAGIAGLIKTVLALHHKKIPATLHFTEPNPNIDFTGTPFYVNNKLQDWQSNGHPHRAGVSSFGIGGTNAHVVLEEAPVPPQNESSQRWHLLPLSARSANALHIHTLNISEHINNHPEILAADAAWTLQQGRKHFRHRATLILCSDSEKTTPPVASQPATAEEREVIFMFSGQGSQYVNIGRDLYRQYPVFKEQVDLCAEILRPHLDLDLRDILYPAEENSKEAARQINQTAITQPALFTIEYSLAKLWNHFGIFPAALVGHSIGEYTAACIAEVFSLEDTLQLVTARGRLMQSLPPGSMLAVPLSSQDVQPYLSPQISLAVINSPSMSVVSGETEHIIALAEELAGNKIEGRILHTSHAFHSPMMEPILEEFRQEVKKAAAKTPQIPFVSNVTGTWITEQQVQSPSYWSKHLRHAVNFLANAEELLTSYPKGIMLEVGPGQTLNLLTRQHPSATENHLICASTRRPVERKDDVQYFLSSLGQLWANGCPMAWEQFYPNEQRKRMPLPTYPFERKRYWLQDGGEYKPKTGSFPGTKTSATYIKQTMTPENPAAGMTGMENLIGAIWLAIIPGLETIRPEDSFYDLGGESLQAVQMLAELEKQTGTNMLLSDLEQNPVLAEFSLITEQKTSGKISQLTKNDISAEIPLSTKIFKAVCSPAKSLPRLLALLRGTYYIISYKLLRKNVTIQFPFYAHTKVVIQGPGHVQIDRSCGAYSNGIEHLTIMTLNKNARVEIGRKCDLAGLTIRCQSQVKLGSRVLTARNLIQDFFLISSDTTNSSDQSSHIQIEDDTWLAMQATVLPGGKIGNGGVLAAQAVLYKAEVADNALASGSPVNPHL